MAIIAVNTNWRLATLRGKALAGLCIRDACGGPAYPVHGYTCGVPMHYLAWAALDRSERKGIVRAYWQCVGRDRRRTHQRRSRRRLLRAVAMALLWLAGIWGYSQIGAAIILGLAGA